MRTASQYYAFSFVTSNEYNSFDQVLRFKVKGKIITLMIVAQKGFCLLSSNQASIILSQKTGEK